MEKKQTENVMKTIRVEKVTVNVGCGNDAKKLDKSMLLLKQMTNKNPIKTTTNKRVASWGLRPGLPIGVMVTLRGKEATDLLERCLAAKEKLLRRSMFDHQGSISFGIKESIDIPGVKYTPEIGILGLQVTATLERPGYGVKRRTLRPGRLPRNHAITQAEAIDFAVKKFGVKLAEE